MTELNEGIKNDAGKPQVGLISGIFLMGLARVLTYGAKKYAAHNWRKGIDLSRCFDALQRHLWAFWMGESNDPETGMSHLDHAACELMFLRELWERHLKCDDRFILSGTGHYFNPVKSPTPNGAVDLRAQTSVTGFCAGVTFPESERKTYSQVTEKIRAGYSVSFPVDEDEPDCCREDGNYIPLLPKREKKPKKAIRNGKATLKFRKPRKK